VTQIGRPRLCQETTIETPAWVVNDFGRRGRAWCETDVEATNLETVIQDLQYSNPVRVVSFNTAEGWSRDISADVATELRRRYDLQMHDIPSNILDFIERYEVARRASLRCGCSDVGLANQPKTSISAVCFLHPHSRH
jgi:hypothetical protein